DGLFGVRGIGLCPPGVIRPALDDGCGPPRPLADESVEVGDEPGRQLELWRPFRERPLAGAVLPTDFEALPAARPSPLLSSAECRQRVGLGAVLGEEDLQDLFELEYWAGARFSEPARERPSAFGSDRVDGPRTSPDLFRRGPSQPLGDQLLRLLVELALRARPDPAERAVHLLGQLVGAPRLDGQQPEDGIRGGGE